MDLQHENAPRIDARGWTPEEHEAARHLLFHEGLSGGLRPGSFTTHLMGALAAADTANRARLLGAFPEFARPLQILSTAGGAALSRALEEATA